MRAAVAAALAVFALASAGCSSGTGGLVSGGADKAHGKQLFTEKCAACHTLAEAKATGKVGPNLDAAFASDRAQGFEDALQLLHFFVDHFLRGSSINHAAFY